MAKRHETTTFCSGACLRIAGPDGAHCSHITCYDTSSNIYTTDNTLSLYPHHGALRASPQHNGAHVLPGTGRHSGAHTQTHSDTVTNAPPCLYSALFVPPLDTSFVPIPDRNPCSACLAKAEARPPVQPCFSLRQPILVHVDFTPPAPQPHSPPPLLGSAYPQP